jgi:hypothetical protein
MTLFNFAKKPALLIISILFLLTQLQSQNQSEEKVYKVNKLVEIPLTVGGFTLNYIGFGLLRDKPRLDSSQILNLNKNDVWFLDRIALNQTTSQRINAQNISDVAMNIMLAAPVLLLIDKKMRKDWFDLLVLYGETHAITSFIYAYGGAMLTKRKRPYNYYPEVPWDVKLGSGSTDSFFSGHTATTAASSFFMAKVISDYHPELGGKKWLIFAGALIPPAIVGYYRKRALKHFPTDIITGTIVGAACGILVPHFHKIVKRKNENLTVVPYVGGYSGLALSLKF